MKQSEKPYKRRRLLQDEILSNVSYWDSGWKQETFSLVQATLSLAHQHFVCTHRLFGFHLSELFHLILACLFFLRFYLLFASRCFYVDCIWRIHSPPNCSILRTVSTRYMNKFSNESWIIYHRTSCLVYKHFEQNIAVEHA